MVFKNPENFAAAAFPGGIERQEKRGQSYVIDNSLLPKEGIPAEELKKLGFTFIGSEDELFNKWKLPKGWKIIAADHNMWTFIVDDRGTVIIEIFYKAAFYDRRANMRMKK
jgi:hypothetical protein